MHRVESRPYGRARATTRSGKLAVALVLMAALGCRRPTPPPRGELPAERAALVKSTPEAAPQTCPVNVNVCKSAADTECLVPVPARTWGAVVYRYRDPRQWNDGGKLPLPHFLLERVKELRRGYWRATPGTAVEQACLAELRAQVAYLRSSLAARGEVLAWENMHGYAHALEQSEWAHVFASVASVLARKGHAGEARELTAAALRLARSLDVPAGVRNGGVRSLESSCSDGVTAATPCFWFHSRGLGIIAPAAPPVFVLNEHLHAVFNSLLLQQTLHENQKLILPSDADAERQYELALSRAVGGLHQLAFPPGDAKLPGFDDFVDRRPDICAHGRPVADLWTNYAIDPRTGGVANISVRGICYYNAHMLQKLADIGRWLEHPDRAALLETLAGQRLKLAFERLLGQGPPPRSGAPRHALALFESAIEPSVLRARGCPQASLVPEVLPDEAFFLTRLRKLGQSEGRCGDAPVPAR